MGEILKFRLSSNHHIASVYVPFDSTWTKLKSLVFGFLNVDYAETMESIDIIDTNNMNAVVEKWNENNFNFHELNLKIAEQDLVFVINMPSSSTTVPLLPPAFSETSSSSFSPSDLVTEHSKNTFLSTDEDVNGNIEFSSKAMIFHKFDKSTFGKIVSHEVPHDVEYTYDLNNEFLKLCASGDVTDLENFLDNSNSIDLATEGETGLFLACSCGHLSLVEALHGREIPIDNMEKSMQLTPLDIACLRKHEELVSWLIDKKCSIARKNKFGSTPLHYICFYTMTPLLSCITKSTADTVSEGGLTLSHYSAGVGSFSFLEHLIMVGAHVNCWDGFGNYPIHYAAAAGVLESVYLLVEVGKCPVDCVNEQGRTPFLVACRSGNIDVAKWLATAKGGDSSRGGGGSNVFIEDQEWCNALHAATLSGSLELIEYVSSLGISISSKNKVGHVPADLTSNEEIKELFKKLEAEKWIRDQNLDKSKRFPQDMDNSCSPQPQQFEEHKSVCKPEFRFNTDSNSIEVEELTSFQPLEHYDEEQVESKADDNSNKLLHEDPHINSFFRAAVSGDIKTIENFISQGHDISVCNENGSQAIHFASQSGHLHIVQILFKAGAELEVYNNIGIQPMTAACSNIRPHKFEMIEWLASQGAEVFSNTSLHYQKQPIYFLASCDFDIPELISFINLSCPLLKYNVKRMNKCEELEWSMLHTCAYHGTAANIESFFEIGMKVGPRLRDTLFTPLHCAVIRDNFNLDLISSVLCHCTYDDMVATDSRERTAIFHACLLGRYDTVRLLADACIDAIFVANVAGNTCLHAASQSGNNHLVRWIESNFPELNMKNNQGAFPVQFSSVSDASTLHHRDPEYLHEAFVTGNVDMLRNAGGVYDLRHEVMQVHPNTDCLYLHYIAGEGLLDAITYFVDEGVSFTAMDSKGWSPLHHAVVNGHVNVMRFFVLQQGVNIFEKCGNDGSSCLHLIIRGYNMESAADMLKRMNMTTELLELGLDVNCQDNSGNTPAHIGASCAWLDMILLLHENGADFHLKNGEMMSVLHEVVIGAGDIIDLGEVEPLIEHLLDFGCDIDMRGKNNLTPFHISCVNGNVELCNFLFENGSNIRLTGGRNNMTAVHIAAAKGQLPVIDWLLSRGLRHDSINSENKTPADIAISTGNNKLYDWLLHVAPTTYEDRFSDCLIDQLFWAVDLGYFALASCILEDFLESSPSLDICTDDGSSLMHAAAAIGNVIYLEELFDRGVGINITSSNDHSPLHTACLYERVGCVKALINLGSDVKACDCDGNTCLHMGVEKNNLEISKLFCDIFDNADVQNKNGWTPLHCCCVGGNCEMLKLLLQQRINLFRYSYDDETPFYIACKFGHCKFLYDIVTYLMTERILISEDIMINSVSLLYSNQHTALAQWLESVRIENGLVMSPLPDSTMFLAPLPTTPKSRVAQSIAKSFNTNTNVKNFLEAVENEDFPYIDALIKSGVDVNSANPSNKMCALHVACVTGNLTLVQLLVNKGAKLNAQNIGGLTPLHISCDRQHEPIAMFLIDIGASLLPVCCNGNTVLHTMASRGLFNPIYQLKNFEKEKLCGLGVRNALGLHALHLAVVTGSMDTCQALLALGCPIDGSNFEGETPLLLACASDINAIVTLLVARGADVNHVDNSQRMPLHVACTTGNMLIAHTLIDSGADVKCLTKNGDSLLHLCAKYDKLLLLKWLLKFGLDLHGLNSSQETPRDCAVVNGNDSVVTWIDSQMSCD